MTATATATSTVTTQTIKQEFVRNSCAASLPLADNPGEWMWVFAQPITNPRLAFAGYEARVFSDEICARTHFNAWVHDVMQRNVSCHDLHSWCRVIYRFMLHFSLKLDPALPASAAVLSLTFLENTLNMRALWWGNVYTAMTATFSQVPLRYAIHFITRDPKCAMFPGNPKHRYTAHHIPMVIPYDQNLATSLWAIWGYVSPGNPIFLPCTRSNRTGDFDGSQCTTTSDTRTNSKFDPVLTHTLPVTSSCGRSFRGTPVIMVSMMEEDD